MEISDQANCLKEWMNFVHILEYYFTRSNVVDDCMKKAVMFSMLVPRNYRLIRALSHPSVPADKSYNEVKSLVQNYVIRKDIVEKAVHRADILC